MHQHDAGEPEDVVLRVKQEALIDIPEGFPGSPRAYYLPLTQNPDLLWPGVRFVNIGLR